MFLFNVQQPKKVDIFMPSLWEKWNYRDGRLGFQNQSVASRPSDCQSRALLPGVRQTLPSGLWFMNNGRDPFIF